MKLIGHKKTVKSISISSDSKKIASGGYDKTVRIWDIETGIEISKLTGHEVFV